MAKTIIYPASMKYLSSLLQTFESTKYINITLDTTTAKFIADATDKMMESVRKLIDATEKEDFSSTDEHMQYCAGEIRGLMDEVRGYADLLEAEISDELWPLPKYSEMLFIK
jgi:glutamine synthetase